MRERLTDLIERMSWKDDAIGLIQSISWHAYREAEKLDDLSMVPELLGFYRPRLKSAVRGAVIFILMKIGKNTQDPVCVEALFGILPRETLKDNLDTLLSGLGEIEKPPGTDLKPIFAFLSDRRWLVRHAAIQALARSHSPDAEAQVLAHLAGTDDKHDQTYCHATLGSIGTEASLPQLRENAKSRKPDVRGSARFALEAIERRMALIVGDGEDRVTGREFFEVLEKTIKPKTLPVETLEGLLRCSDRLLSD